MKSRRFWLGRAVCAAVMCGLMVSAASAALFSDADMFLDPWSVPEAVYSKVWLTDLSTANTHTWSSTGDAVVGAQIAPVLRAGTYSPGYVFSQADYALTSNVDYTADLTSGTLTATFLEGGLYHVRVSRQSGVSEVFAIFAQAFSAPAGNGKTQPPKIVDIPDADLYIISQSPTSDPNNDPTACENMAVSVITKLKGEDKVERASSVSAAQKLINALPGTGNHVELMGHGTEGGISIGGGFICNLVSTGYEGTSATDFAEAVGGKVGLLTHLSCNTGGGEDGKEYLKELMDNGISKATGYASEVFFHECSEASEGGYMSVPFEAGSEQVPEPAAMSLLAFGALVLIRRRST